MKNYKRIVAFCVSLCAVLISGALNALFMTPASDFFRGLIVPVNPTAHSLLWLVDYLIIAVVMAELLTEKSLRGKIKYMAALLLGNALWCAVFFRLHAQIAALIISFVLLADLVYILVLTVKHTKTVGFFTAALLCRYAYLTGLQILILILN